MEEKYAGLRFTNTGKLYYINSSEVELKIGEKVVVESDRGHELARIVSLNKTTANPEEIVKFVRKAEKADQDKVEKLKNKAKEALVKCNNLAKKYKLDMKLINAEYTFDESKLVFYFTAEDRVDFRELVKELATEYRVRIELRQVGPRDEIKSYPTVGSCGRELCCRTFLTEFEPVTIKMAKEQGLQINMPKLSGNCGKLMCCLKYEEETYKEKLKTLPKINEIVMYNKENAKVVSQDILKQKVKLKLGKPGEEHFEIVDVSEIERTSKKEDNK